MRESGAGGAAPSPRGLNYHGDDLRVDRGHQHRNPRSWSPPCSQLVLAHALRHPGRGRRHRDGSNHSERRGGGVLEEERKDGRRKKRPRQDSKMDLTLKDHGRGIQQGPWGCRRLSAEALCGV